MKPACMRTFGAMGLATLGMAFASSCAVPRTGGSAARGPAPAMVMATAWPGRLVQLAFGREAVFAQCVPPACPTVTPKTLAAPVPAAHAATSTIESPSAIGPNVAVVATAPARVLQTPSDSAAPDLAVQESVATKVIVHFRFGRAMLDPTERARIDQVAQALPSARQIAISGRTDSVGSWRSNQTLALARASAVRDHLLANFPHLRPRVTQEAQGTCCFAVSNQTAIGRALNRRAELVFIHGPEDL